MSAQENLWAPWRMDYILADKDEGGCFLCEAAESENDRASFVVARGEKCFAVLNLYPYSNGHILVAPYKHEADMANLSAGELGEMMQFVIQAKQTLDAVMAPHGYNIGFNLGRAAGAGLESHIHLHIVPRWDGDTNFMPVIGETKVIPQHIEEVWEKVTEAFREC